MRMGVAFFVCCLDRPAILEGPATIAETITLDAAKWEFIKVERNGGCGIYTLNVTTLSREGV